MIVKILHGEGLRNALPFKPVPKEFWNNFMNEDESIQKILHLFTTKQYKEGLVLTEKLLASHLDNSSLWEMLGSMLYSENLTNTAIAAYRRALELGHPSLTIYSNMANALQKANLLSQAIEYRKLSVKQNPNDSHCWMGFGITLRELDLRREALDAFEKSVACDPKNYLSLFNIAAVYLYFGNYTKGWEIFENRFLAYPNKYLNRPEVPVWQGDNLEGKTLLVLPEQGLGDVILCSRFIPLIKQQSNGRIIFIAPTELARLFIDIENIDFLQSAPADKIPNFDFYLNIMSLPLRLKINTLEDIPPPTTLHIPDKSRKIIQSFIKPYKKRFKIGIVWSGKITNEINYLRSIPLIHFLRLYEVPGIELFSFQKGTDPRDQDIENLRSKLLIHKLSDQFHDLADTAAGVEAMDLMILIDSSVCHLSGSLGKPTWILLHKGAYWLWLNNRQDSPWYPTVRLYRQKTRGEWTDVFDTVVQDLANLSP